jgi:hypothetical protein
MFERRGVRVAGALLCLVFGFGNAAADSAASSVSAGVAVDGRAIAAGHLARIEAAARGVRHRSDVTLRAGPVDPMKTLCLQDKVTQLQALVVSAGSRHRQHEAAIAVGDTDVASHHLAALAVLRRRAEQLEAEANLCVGVTLPSEGTHSTTWTVDPNVADPPDPFGRVDSVDPIGGATPTLPVGPASPVK